MKGTVIINRGSDEKSICVFAGMDHIGKQRIHRVFTFHQEDEYPIEQFVPGAIAPYPEWEFHLNDFHNPIVEVAMGTQ